MLMRRRRPALRTRRDAPDAHNVRSALNGCSLHSQGCAHGVCHVACAEVLLPAPAGLSPPGPSEGLPQPTAPCAGRCVPQRPKKLLDLPIAPRTCGDVPTAFASDEPSRFCSPHPRGVPRHVDGFIHEMSCSPHTRGCSQGERLVDALHELLPAPSGMLPASLGASATNRSASRTGGDAPGCRWPPRLPSAWSPHHRGILAC
jgi:hypothetical protein